MHERLIEAEKQLQIAKDAYAKAIENIDRQYVKPLAGAGIEADGVAAVRSNYDVTAEVAPLAEAEQPHAGKPSTSGKKKK